MIVAEEKRKNNISEYILYMWQIEDAIRALDVNMEKITDVLINNYKVSDEKREQISTWFSNLTLMMTKEQKTQTGHLQFLENLVNDLNRFHLALLNEQADMEYTRIYNEIKPDLELVRSKSGQNHHDIEVALNTLYILLMLKIKNQAIEEDTQKAVWKFGNFMGYFSKLYKAFEQGNLTLESYS